MKERKENSGTSKGNVSGNPEMWQCFILSVLHAVKRQKRLVKRNRRQDSKKARQMKQ